MGSSFERDQKQTVDFVQNLLTKTAVLELARPITKVANFFLFLKEHDPRTIGIVLKQGKDVGWDVDISINPRSPFILKSLP